MSVRAVSLPPAARGYGGAIAVVSLGQCWADASPFDGASRRLQCREKVDPKGFGLCDKHREEILG